MANNNISIQLDRALQRFQKSRCSGEDGSRLDVWFRRAQLTADCIGLLRSRLRQDVSEGTQVSLRFEYCDFESNAAVEELGFFLGGAHVVALTLVQCENILCYSDVALMLRNCNKLNEVQFSTGSSLNGISAPLRACSHLEKLVLQNGLIAQQVPTDVPGMNELAHGLSQMKNLKVFRIDHPCNDESLDILLRALQPLESQLEKLDLSIHTHVTFQSLGKIAELLKRQSTTKTTLNLTLSNCPNMFSKVDHPRFVDAFFSALNQEPSARIQLLKLNRVGIRREDARRLFHAVANIKGAQDGIVVHINEGEDLFSSSVDGCFEKDDVFQALLLCLERARRVRSLWVEDQNSEQTTRTSIPRPRETESVDNERDRLLYDALKQNTCITRTFFWVNRRKWLSSKLTECALIYQRNDCLSLVRKYQTDRRISGRDGNVIYMKLFPRAIKAFCGRVGRTGEADVIFEMIRSEVETADWAVPLPSKRHSKRPRLEMK